MTTPITEELKKQFPEFELLFEHFKTIDSIYRESLRTMGLLNDFKLSSASSASIEILVNSNELLTNNPIIWSEDGQKEDRKKE